MAQHNGVHFSKASCFSSLASWTYRCSIAAFTLQMRPIAADGVAWSVCICLFVSHTGVPRENGRTDRDVVWSTEFWRSKVHRVLNEEKEHFILGVPDRKIAAGVSTAEYMQQKYQSTLNNGMTAPLLQPTAVCLCLLSRPRVLQNG